MLDLWNNSLYQNELGRVSLAEEVWEKFYGKNFLITGATGMIGSFLVDALMKKNVSLAEDDRMRVFLPVRNMNYAEIRFSAHVNSDFFCLHKMDITHIGQELDDFKFDYIISAAGSADPKQFSEHPVETMRGNLYGLTNLLEIAKKNPETRMIYVSTGEVYGNAGTEIEAFVENDSYYIDSMDVRACYPNSKRAAETFCAAYHKQYGVDTVIGRLCYVYGPTIKDTDSRSVAQFLQKAVRGENIVLKSKGEQIRSYCYIVDAISALLFLLVRGAGGEAYNIAHENSNCSIADFAALIAQSAGVSCIHEIAEESEKAGYSRVAKAVQCPEKINHLGWKAETMLEDGVKKTIRIMQG